MGSALRKVAGRVRSLAAVRAVYRYGVRTVGKRFTRFAFGSAMALAVSEITLLACLGAIHLWPTVSAVAAWFAGAVTSYLLSRWAWERSGRPHLLKETLPFLLIAVGTIVVLSSATSLAHQEAVSLGLRPIPRLAFVGGAYLAANAMTFLSRFVIFHYVLFADRGPKAPVRGSAPSAAGPVPSRPVPAEAARPVPVEAASCASPRTRPREVPAE